MTSTAKQGMAAPINLSASEEKPRLIDAQAVTAVFAYPDRNQIFVFNKDGLYEELATKHLPADMEQLLQKLAAAGHALVPMPLRRDGTEYPQFVSPAAVTYVTVAEPTSTGATPVIVGTKGVQWQSNYDARPEEIAGLLDAVRSTGKTLLQFGPDQAQANWQKQAALYVDPVAVREIRDDGMQLIVSFAHTGELHVTTAIPGYDGLREFERKQEAANRVALAATLAGANGTLTQVTGIERAIYIHPEEYTDPQFHTVQKNAEPARYAMSLKRQKTEENPHADILRLYFNTEAERETSFKGMMTQSGAARREKKTASHKAGKGGAFDL